MHRQYFRDFPPPYVVAYVRLEEGPMVVSTMVAGREGKLRCDLPVTAVFEALSDEVSVLKFTARRMSRRRDSGLRVQRFRHQLRDVLRGDVVAAPELRDAVRSMIAQ